MFRIRVAELLIDIEPRYALIGEWCRDYMADLEEGKDPDISIQISDQEIRREISACPYPIDPEAAELISVSKALGKELPRFDALFLHAATFTIDGKAYAICADSGTGKSTLLRSCKELLGRRVGLVNGDKTVIRYLNGRMIAFGSPWCGKEHWGENTSCPLHGLILLSRGEENRIEEVNPMLHLTALMRQVYIPREGSRYGKNILELLNRLFEQTRVYDMTCRKDPEAARALFRGIHIDLGEEGNRR